MMWKTVSRSIQPALRLATLPSRFGMTCAASAPLRVPSRAASHAIPAAAQTPSIHKIPVDSSAKLTEPKVIGNPSRGIHSISNAVFSDIVGFNTVGAHRLSGGDLLSAMDLCAVRTSQNHCQDQIGPAHNQGFSFATISTFNTVFHAPVLHGDAVKVAGSVVHAGNSSLGLFIRVFRESFASRTLTLVAESFFTMVAIGKDLRPQKMVPAVALYTAEQWTLHERYNSLKVAQDEKDRELARLQGMDSLTADLLETPENKAKAVRVPMSISLTEATRIFMSSHLNMNSTIFGGELMRWMELHATHCARMFTRNRHVFSVRMHHVSFSKPVMATDWVSLRAKVVFVHQSTMEVDVELVVERDNKHVTTNKASFLLINTDDIGQKLPVDAGLDLQRATKSELVEYGMGKFRAEESAKRRNLYGVKQGRIFRVD